MTGSLGGSRNNDIIILSMDGKYINKPVNDHIFIPVNLLI